MFDMQIYMLFGCFLIAKEEGCCRQGQALDLHDDYLPNAVKQGKENAAPESDSKADDIWPQVEIRVANNKPGSSICSSAPRTWHDALYFHAHELELT